MLLKFDEICSSGYKMQLNIVIRQPIYISIFFIIIYFLSGFSSLVYETLWLRFFTRILGNSSQAVAIILIVFMSGLGCGSILGARICKGNWNKLLVYLLLEVGIAVSGLLSYVITNHVSYFLYESGLSPTLFAGINNFIISIFIFTSTTLMGATYPIILASICRFNADREKWTSILYGTNTFGAVLGVLVSGFFLIGEIGEFHTLLTAVFINTFIVILIFFFIKSSKLTYSLYETGNEFVDSMIKKENIISIQKRFKQPMILYAFFCGFISLAFEIFWTRKMVFWNGSSIYSFTTMLGVFLGGTFLGSFTANIFLNKQKFNYSAILKNLSSALTILLILSPITFYLISLIPGINSEKDFFVYSFSQFVLGPFLLIFPITFILGFIFPIYVSECDKTENFAAGEQAGFIYGINTIGAIFGAFIARFVLLPYIGTSSSIIIAGTLFLSCDFFVFKRYNSKRYLYFFPFIIGIISFTIYFDPIRQIISNRLQNHIERSDYEVYFNKEDSLALTTAFEKKLDGRNIKQLWVNGIGMTKICTETQLMAHLPLNLTEKPSSMAIICLGMGTTLVSGSYYESLKVIDVIELVPNVIKCFKYFFPDEIALLNDKRISFINADGRNYLLCTKKKYDVITIDPAPPIYSAGTVNLYSKEFHKICLDKITDNGSVCLWVPNGYFSEIKLILNTFIQSYPYTYFWSGPKNWGIYCIGRKTPILKPEISENLSLNEINNDLNKYSKEERFSYNRFFNDYFMFDGHLAKQFFEMSELEIIEDNYPYTEFPINRYIRNKLDGQLIHEYFIEDDLTFNAYIQQNSEK